MRTRPISDNKQKLIDEYNASPLKVGETVSVPKALITSYLRECDVDKTEYCTIESLDGGIFVFEGHPRDRKPYHKSIQIKESDIKGRYDVINVGANPFDESNNSVRPVAYSFDSILFGLDILGDKRIGKEYYDINGSKISECNWNPFVYTKEGKKEYYQRDFVWTERDKQLLVESIYQGIDCGKILVRKRGWGELEAMQAAGETELAFNDLVDGKQRLNAVKEFIEGKFRDMQGNYYSDLSPKSQSKFTSHQLFSYAEMPESTKDSDVIKQFLKMNFAGVPQSIEHIEFVKTINNKL